MRYKIEVQGSRDGRNYGLRAYLVRSHFAYAIQMIAETGDRTDRCGVEPGAFIRDVFFAKAAALDRLCQRTVTIQPVRGEVAKQVP
ncbi:MAG: hypothetical protein BWY82_00890 [Verrucomicrobia bacterium ADurb.Bin474]|nr:MAG: hypothetical protein BWY82_00890 [Verrucomicrobia bacterium ADurb.Bin474]